MKGNSSSNEKLENTGKTSIFSISYEQYEKGSTTLIFLYAYINKLKIGLSIFSGVKHHPTNL